MRIEQLNPMTSARLEVIDVDATVRAAALSLSKPGIGLVIVCRGNGAAAGVLSKSDLVRYLTNPMSSSPPVSTLMSKAIVSCSHQDDVHMVWQTMAELDLQNIPVLDVGGKPVGILDIRDALKALFEQEEMQEQMLFNYVTGVGYR